MKSRTESIQEELERREEEIRLKVESILDEEDDEVRTARIRRLNSHELEVLNERMDEINEEFGEVKEGIDGRHKSVWSSAEEMLEFGVRPEDSLHTCSIDEFVEKVKKHIVEKFNGDERI